MISKVLFLNVTKFCNMECPRCYLTKESRQSPLKMPLSYIEAALSHNFFQTADEVTVVFQGGEAQIVGHKALLKYVDLIATVLPTAKMAMVSNLFSFPLWLHDFAVEYLDGRIETTYASGNKMNLSNSEDEFQSRFSTNLSKAIRLGLRMPINVELNKETVIKGPSSLVELAKKTGAKIWEFDFSVHFDEFNRFPIYDNFGYPRVPKSVTYSEFFEFIFEFGRLYEREIGDGLVCSVLDQFKRDSFSNNFNIQRESDFITLNPDGSVTTNPLFSDMSGAYIGNLNSDSFEDCLNSSKRLRRIIKEQVRIIDCSNCPHIEKCGGGVSHLPIYDGSETCVGGKQFWRQ